jgi:hypothetical protein
LPDSNTDICSICGLKAGFAVQHNCIDSLKAYNKELKEMVVALLNSPKPDGA